MKKYLPYILIVLLVAAVVTLVITGDNGQKKKLNEKITLQRRDKIPYGMYVAFNTLHFLFPQADISTTRNEPGYWETIRSTGTDQLLIIITDRFGPDEHEVKELFNFAERGNDVFISAINISSDAGKAFRCNNGVVDLAFQSVEDLDEKFSFSLSNPPFGRGPNYGYPGRTFGSYFIDVDTSITHILGRDVVDRPNFIQLKAGRGNFFIHLEPLAFSNYFLLHKNNIAFYENAMSLVRPGIKKIAWDEYYLNKRERQPPKKKEGWMSVLFRYPAFKAGLLTAILGLLLYVLVEMRRKQRPILVIKKPKNDSLEFVKTIGRLYYDKADHRNLCRKMSAYFLEHVRNKYKLPTGVLDDEFIKSLRLKSGAGENEVREIVTFINGLEKAETVTPGQLTGFHKRLESFYKKT